MTQAKSKLAVYLAGLPRLQELLYASGEEISLDAWINVHDLLLQLDRDGGLPERFEGLRPLLGPLLCRGQESQERFQAIFEDWRNWAVSESGHKALGDPAGVEEALLPVDAKGGPIPSGDASSTPQDPPGPWRRPWGIAIFLGLLLLAALAWWGLARYFMPAPDLPPPAAVEEPIPAPSPEIPPPAPPEITDTDYLEKELHPLPPRAPRERPALSAKSRAQLRAADIILPSLLLILTLGWFAWRWRRRWIALRRGPANPDDPFGVLRIEAPVNDIFTDPKVRAALRRLHQVRTLPTRRLDARATVRETVRGAGLFSPVYWQRPEVPEVVVLVEHHHGADHLAGLGTLVARRLTEAGLFVHCYDYRQDPRLLRKQEDGQRHSLSEIADRHPNSRLLLIGDASALLDLWEGRPKNWVIPAFLPWSQRGILDTRPEDAWWEILEQADFRTASLGNGLIALSHALTDGNRMDTRSATSGLPEGLSHADRWLQPIPPPVEERTGLLRALRGFLDEAGLYLLGAIAAYPQLHWGLTRALEYRLLATENGASGSGSITREIRLLRLSQLPWFTEGWLPDWLREILLDNLIPRQHQRIREVYRELFLHVGSDKKDAMALPVSAPPARKRGLGGWRRYLADLFRAHQDSPIFRDRVFASMMLGRGRKLDFRIHANLVHRLPGIKRLPALARAILGALLVAGTLVAGSLALWQGTPLWDWNLRSWGEELLLADQIAANEKHHFAIVHENNPALAGALAGTLRRFGFSKENLGPDLREKIARGIGARHEILMGPGADRRGAEEIARRLSWLAHRRSPMDSGRDAGLPEGASRGKIAIRSGEEAESVPFDTIVVRLAANPTPDAHVYAWDSLREALPEQRKSTFDEPDKLTAAMGDFYGPKVYVGWGERSEPQQGSDERSEPQQGSDERSEPQQGSDERSEPQQGSDERSEPQQGSQWVAGQEFRDPLKSGGEGPSMMVLPAGEFMMGSLENKPERYSNEGPQHRVRIGKPFALGVTEVTFADYDRFAKATGRKLPGDEGWGRDQRPVINVSWYDAMAYAQWLSKETGKEYRLPTEAEWEYAARAGTKTPFSTGECITTDQANYNGDVDYADCGAKTGVARGKTVPAGALPANPWGLHEMHGNVYEWTCSLYKNPYDGSEKRCTSKESDGGRALRGGARYSGPRWLRSAVRGWLDPDAADYIIGFRLARAF